MPTEKTSRSKYSHYKEEWVTKYEEGMSYSAIGKEYQVSKHTVQHLIRDRVQKREKSPYDKHRDTWYDLYVNQMYSTNEIATKYGTSAGVVARQLRKAGVEFDTLGGPKKKYLHLLDEWISLYQAGISVHDIGQRHGANGQTVHNYLKEAGIEIRDYSEAARKYPVDESYFEDVDTPEKAYWLGWMFSSGSLSEHVSSVAINLSCRHRDLDRILAFRKALGTEKTINQDQEGAVFNLRIPSRPLYEKLTEWGMNPRKHLSQRFPSRLSSEFHRPFILGYFEGKSSRTGHALTVSGTGAFLSVVKDILEQEVGVTPVFKQWENDGHMSGRLSFYRKGDHVRLMDWLYSDSPYSSEILLEFLFPQEHASEGHGSGE